MTTTLVVIGCIVAYFAVGAIYARSQAARIYAEAKERWCYDDLVDETTLISVLSRVFVWPVTIVWDFFITGFLFNWLMRPVDDRKAEAAQLRDDIATWKNVMNDYGASPAERDMAQKLVSVLSEKADRLNI